MVLHNIHVSLSPSKAAPGRQGAAAIYNNTYNNIHIPERAHGAYTYTHTFRHFPFFEKKGKCLPSCTTCGGLEAARYTHTRTQTHTHTHTHTGLIYTGHGFLKISAFRMSLNQSHALKARHWLLTKYVYWYKICIHARHWHIQNMYTDTKYLYKQGTGLSKNVYKPAPCF